MPSSNKEKKKDGVREIKKREDPRVWESKMLRSKKEEVVLVDSLWSEQRNISGSASMHSQSDIGPTLVEVLIRLSCLQEPLQACN